MNLFDRVVVKEDFIITGLDIIKSGTIGTVRNLTSELATIQIDFIDGRQKLITTSIQTLRNATTKDLDMMIKTVADCMKIINPMFSPGSKYITLNDEIFVIEAIILALNEEYDLFYIKDKNKKTEQVNRKFIDSASYIPFEETKLFMKKEISKETEIPTETFSKTEEPLAPKIIRDQPSKVEIDEFKISINGFEFNIREDNIDLGIITRDKLEVYINTLTKLKNILKEKKYHE